MVERDRPSDDARDAYKMPDSARLKRETDERIHREAQEATRSAKEKAVAAGLIGPVDSAAKPLPRPKFGDDEQAEVDARNQAIANEAESEAYEAAGGDAAFGGAPEPENDAGDQA